MLNFQYKVKTKISDEDFLSPVSERLNLIYKFDHKTKIFLFEFTQVVRSSSGAPLWDNKCNSRRRVMTIKS